MTVYNDWVVEYKNGSTWTEIPNVQDVQLTIGRQTAIDRWSPSSGQITIWYPTGFDAPLANLTVGAQFRIFAPGRSSTKPSWTGWVKDTRLDLGQPWNTTTSEGNADFLTIDLEGELARIGRWSDYPPGNVSGNAQINYVFDTLIQQYGSHNGMSATWAEFRQMLINTNGAPVNINTWLESVMVFGVRVCDGIKITNTSPSGPQQLDDPGIYGAVPETELATVAFSDQTNDATHRLFDQFEFGSVADTYYNQALINVPDGSPTAGEYTSSVGSGPYRSYYTSISGLLEYATVGPAINRTQSLTDYFANAFSDPVIEPSVISATTARQHTQNLDTLGFTDLELGYLVTKCVEVEFRGNTFICRIEGVQITADTEQTRFTFYVSDTGTTGWFILDDANLGVLDQNRLGIY